MRPKIAVMILLPAILAIGVIIYLKPHSSAPVPDVAPVPAVSVAPTPAPEPAPAPPPVVVKKTVTPEERQAAIDAETDKLAAWSMNNDPQSLSNILADLTSPEKEIRLAAIEAAKQFGDTNAIPTLKNMAANDEDNEEKTALQEAADFLALPSFTLNRTGQGTPATPEQIQIKRQMIQQARAENEASKQVQPQKRPHNRSSPSASGQNSTASQNSTTGQDSTADQNSMPEPDQQ